MLSTEGSQPDPVRVQVQRKPLMTVFNPPEAPAVVVVLPQAMSTQAARFFPDRHTLTVAAFADPGRYLLRIPCRKPGYKTTGKLCELRSPESAEVRCVGKEFACHLLAFEAR